MISFIIKKKNLKIIIFNNNKYKYNFIENYNKKNLNFPIEKINDQEIYQNIKQNQIDKNIKIDYSKSSICI